MDEIDKTLTGMRERMNAAKTRGYAGAYERGWRSARETEAFLDGARWILEQMHEHCDIKPKPLA